MCCDPVQVIKLNDYQKTRFAQNIVRCMFNTVSGKSIALFGFAFKKDTGDVRETAAAYVSKMLLDERANIKIYDPKVDDVSMFMEMDYTLGVNEDNTPHLKKSMQLQPDPYTAAEGAHAIAVMTEWDEFKTLDYQRMYDSMHKPVRVTASAAVLDTVLCRAVRRCADSAEEWTASAVSCRAQLARIASCRFESGLF